MNLRTALHYSALGGMVLVLSSPAVLAKRGAPAKVEPIVHAGVRYSVPNDNGRRAYVVAADEKAGRRLWEATIFTNVIDPELEEDVQWVFVKQMKLKDGKLLITSEKGETFQLDPATRKVTPLK